MAIPATQKLNVCIVTRLSIQIKIFFTFTIVTNEENTLYVLQTEICSRPQKNPVKTSAVL